MQRKRASEEPQAQPRPRRSSRRPETEQQTSPSAEAAAGEERGPRALVPAIEARSASGTLRPMTTADPRTLQDRIAVLESEASRLEQCWLQERSRVHAILSLGAALGSSLELDQVLRVVLESVTRLLDADRSTIFLVDERREYLISMVAQGHEESDFRLRMGEGIAGWVARSGRSVNLKDAYADRRFDPSFDQTSGYRTRSMLAVPVHDPRHHRTLGVIQVLNKRQGYFTTSDEELLRSLSAQAAITLENSRLISTVMLKNMELCEIQERLTQKVAEVDNLYELSRRMQRTQTEAELVELVLERTVALVPCEVAGLLVLDEEGGRLSYTVRPVDLPARSGSLRLQPDEGLVGRVVREGSCITCDWSEVEAAHRLRLSEEFGLVLKSALAVPLMVNERTFGALQVANRRGAFRRFSPEDAKLLSLIADHAATALDLQRQIADRAQRERLAAIGQLLSSVLHDIKGPITIISGYVQLMATKDKAAERERYAGIIQRQFEHLAAMTQEVLAFARGETTLLIRRCNVHRFLGELEELFRQQVAGRNIELTIRDDYSGVANFDQVKLTRALVNLVRNSIEAMSDGGSLQVVASREGQELIFTVTDTGTGIPEEIRGRLFRSFVTQGKAEGSGLGLAMVRKIVQEHGGTVSYESEPGLGTRFELRLPQGTDADEEAGPGPANRPRGSTSLAKAAGADPASEGP